MDVSIDYKLVGTGWSRCVVDIYGQTCTLTASYLSDALQELASGVNHILAGGNEARFSFTEEPGEYRWILRASDGGVHVLILDFEETWGDKPDSEGKVMLEANCDARSLAEALLTTLEQLLEEHGLKGYKNSWAEHEFPVNDYMTLCNRLGRVPSNLALQRTAASSGH